MLPSLRPTRFSIPRRLAHVAALLLGLAVLHAPALAQSTPHNGHSAADHVEGSLFVVKVGPNGDLVCEHASETETAALRSAAGAPPNFTVFTSTNAEQDITGMRILLRGTDQILEFPAALLAFRRAAARWERAISTPITTVIDVDFGPNRFNGGPFPENVLASATNGGRTFSGIGTSEIVEALLQQNGDDPQLAALYNGIPVPTPSTAGSDLQRPVVARPLAQAFGYLPAEADPDPTVNPFGEFATIGFNAAFSWDFDPTDGVDIGVFDFEGVALHEMGHSLGFTSIIGQGGPPNNFYAVLDLFRVRPEAVTPGEPLDDGQGWEVAERVVTPGPPSDNVVQVFFDGLQELPLSTATGSRQGGDGQQASHWRDDAFGTPLIGIMDPNFASGTAGTYSDNDLRAFQAMGYRVIYDVQLATGDVTVDGVPYDVQLPDSLVYLDLGDVATGSSLDLEVGLANTSTDVTLDYSAEVEVEVAFPAGTSPSLALSTTSGGIAPGASETITLSAGAPQEGVFYGTLRVETNIDGILLFEVPFRFSVGGAEAPQLAVSSEMLGDLGDFDDNASESFSLIELTNGGGLVLDYAVSISLETDGNPFPFDPLNGFGNSGDPIFVTPSAGSLSAGESQEITATVEGGPLDPGYYIGEVEIVTNSLEFSSAGVPVGFTGNDGVRVIQTTKTLPFTLTVGDPVPPILAVTDTPTPVSVPADQTALTELDVENAGQAPLTFLRVLEPALSRLSAPPRPADATAKAGSASADLSAFLGAAPATRKPTSAARGMGGDSLFAIILPDAGSIASAITQVADGRILVADADDGGPTYVIRRDLSAIDAILDGFVDSASGQVSGLTYDDKNGTLWYATTSGEVFEATFGETIEPTGRSFTVNFSAGGLAYSPELDAFFVSERLTSLIYAVNSDGDVLPGYPVETPSRGGSVPTFSVTDGVLEVFSENRAYTQVDQFGQLFAESEDVEVPTVRLGGALRINGFFRSRLDPDGVLYYLTRPGGGEVRVIGVDPTDLPVYTRSIVEVEEPFFGVDVAPGTAQTFDLRVAPRGLTPGSYTETVAFLTNNPDDGRLVQTTLDVEVTMGTPIEAGAAIPTEFAVHQNYPNPFAARTTVRFDLPSAARATVTVFNVLGQRVAVLLDDEALEAGAHTVAFDARSLASGTYLVRVEADASVGARRITVVK